MSRQGTKKILRIGIYSLIALIVIGYAIFASFSFIQGPEIEISYPENGSTFASSTLEIRGVVERSQDITLNGRSILIDDKGNFDEHTLLSPGYNVFTLHARDKFGRSREYRLELVYKVN